jgi:molybdopterin-guanine dinucleotide biosynthesis protein A
MASEQTRPAISGYVLAGGRSSRMGTDKALLRLAGKPLIEHAVTKLRRICADVHILSGNPALAPYAPRVPDLHPGCGPIGGMESALTHSSHHWNLFLPVDLPFLPAAFLDAWVRNTLADAPRNKRIALFNVDGVPQPTVLLIHREAAPYIVQAVARGDFKLFPTIEFIGQELAARHSLRLEDVFRVTNWASGGSAAASAEASQRITSEQRATQALWFANLNTPQDFAEAEAHIAALDA